MISNLRNLTRNNWKTYLKNRKNRRLNNKTMKMMKRSRKSKTWDKLSRSLKLLTAAVAASDAAGQGKTTKRLTVTSPKTRRRKMMELMPKPKLKRERRFRKE